MVATRRKPKPVTVADPDAPITMAEAARLAGVSKSVLRDRRPELKEAGAVQLNATRWEMTARHLEAARIIRILPPKKKPEADPLEAAQAAREAARAAEAAEVRRNSPTREESAGTPPPSIREAERWQEKRRAEAAADPYGARVRQTAEHARVTGVHWTEGMPGASDTAVTIAELRHAAELAEARHAAEIADARRQIAEAEAKARAWQERAGTMEMLATERGQMIAMLQAMLGGTAPVTRALDA